MTKHAPTIFWLFIAGCVIGGMTLSRSLPQSSYEPAYASLPDTKPRVYEPRPYEYSPATSLPTRPIAPAVPAFVEPAVTISTGEISYSGPRRRVAPLEIKTRLGTNYYVKAVDAASGEVHLTLFVEGGDTLEVLMPIGEYEIKYATGGTWYGEEYFFGPSTAYARADAPFYFTRDSDGYTGYTVELFKSLDGNLEMQDLAADEF